MCYIYVCVCLTFVGNLKNEDKVLEWLIEQKSKKTSRMMIIITGVLFFVTLISIVTETTPAYQKYQRARTVAIVPTYPR